MSRKYVTTVDVDGDLYVNGFCRMGLNTAPKERFFYGTTYIENGGLEVGNKHSGFVGNVNFYVFCPSEFFGTVKLAADPTQPLQAATKQYVDNAIAGGGLTKPLADTYYVNVEGDTMTGQLNAPRLRATSTSDSSLTSTLHPFQIGPDNSRNMRFDTYGDIQMLDNGLTTGVGLQLQPLGGDVTFGGQTEGRASSVMFRTGTTVTVMETPTLLQHVANKQYVDTQDALGVLKTGDTMTGLLTANVASGPSIVLRNTPNSPHVSWYSADNVTRYAYIQAFATEFRQFADQGSPMTFYTGGTETLRIRANATGEIVTVAGNPDATINFRPDSPTGAAHGYIGKSGTWGMRCTASTGDALLQAAAGDARVQAGSGGGLVDFYPNAALLVRLKDPYMLVGGITTETNADVAGGIWRTGQYFLMANQVVNTPIFVANKNGAGVGAGHDFMHFRNNSTNIGSITRNASTAAVLFNTSSDYRLKNDLGPITGAIERLKLLKPKRITWKEDETAQEMDAFLAHEVTPAVPEAVTGEKDAVAGEKINDTDPEEGTLIPQQLDYARIVPLLTAAVQELTARVEELEGV